jgi:large subunit ribosomal protein L4
VVVDEINVSQPKTKELVGKLKGMELNDVLVVSVDPDENLYLAARNLYGVDVRDVEEIDPVSLVAYEHILVTENAVKKLEERLA